jgi:hypothetical protein
MFPSFFFCIFFHSRFYYLAPFKSSFLFTPLAAEKSTVNPAKGLTKIQSPARAVPALSADSKSVVPVKRTFKAPAAAFPGKLGPAFDEAAPSWYNDNYGPYSTVGASKSFLVYITRLTMPSRLR